MRQRYLRAIASIAGGHGGRYYLDRSHLGLHSVVLGVTASGKSGL